MKGMMHWLLCSETSRVLAYHRVDVTKICQDIILVKMTMNLWHKLFLRFVLEWWEHLLLSHTFSYRPIFLSSHVQLVIEIIYIIFDLAELCFKLRFLVIPLEK